MAPLNNYNNLENLKLNYCMMNIESFMLPLLIPDFIVNRDHIKHL